MRPTRRLASLAALFTAAVLTIPASAPAETPWRMFQLDAKHTGRTTLAGPAQPGVDWTYTTTLENSTPVVGADGTIYLPSGKREDQAGTLRAINPDGTEKWVFTLPGAPASTPAVATDGTIYVHTYETGNIASIEHLVAVNPNGTEKWDITPFNFGAANLVSFDNSSPVVGADGRIWVGSRDAALYSFNPADGSLSCDIVYEESTSSPALAADGTVYIVGLDSTLYAFEPDCDFKWSFELSAGVTSNPQSPAVAADGTIWVGDRDERLVAVNPNGTEKCRFTTQNDVDSTPAFGSDGTVYVGSSGLYAVDPDDCSQEWKFPSGTVLFSSSSPVVDGDGTIYWGHGFTYYAVNPNGTQRWQLTKGAGSSGIEPSPVVAVSGKLYLVDGGFSSNPRRLRALVDNIDPAAPSITDTDPDSPANDNDPEVKGTAEAGSTVRLYTTSDCGGAAAAEGSAASFASPGLTVTVAADSSTAFRATATDPAGNTSACSGPLTYVEDSTVAAPSITDTDPDSPAADNNPEVKGTAEAGSTVRLYETSDCSGTPVADGPAASFASPGLTVTVPADSSTAFRATATDAAGNLSACSSPLTYVEDSTKPAAPSVTDTDPDSPANDNNPEVKGSAEAGSTVRLYTTGSCTGSPAATGSAASFASPGLTVTVGDNSSTAFRATATDAAGNVSDCSAALTYVEDSASPSQPTLTDTDPDSPANDTSPEVRGTAESASTVRLYTTSDCSGPPAAEGSAASFASPGLTVTVAADSSTAFRATATDAAGNTSLCSSSSIVYTEDSSAPATPSVTDTDPDSPANDNSPEVKGTAESGSTVRLYTTSDCSGPPAAEGSAASFASPGLTVTVADQSSTDFRATATDAAGHLSACSGPLTYVEDSTVPAAPTLTDTDPDSPANENSPEVKGTAEAGTTVKLYTTATCTGTPVAEGSAASFSSPGLTVTVPDDSSTTLRATATSGAQTSACSAPLTYDEDSTAPEPPTLTDSDPVPPANDNSPLIRGAAEGGSTVRLYTASDCSGSVAAEGAAAAFGSAGLAVTVPDDATTTFRATATDAAGNTSPCSTNSIPYSEDSTAPETAIDSGPSGTTTDSTPTFSFSSNEPGSTFECRVDAAAFAPCSPPHTTEPLSTGGHTFEVRATDTAGNLEPGPAGRSFTVSPDSDGDGVPDAQDACPAVFALTANGCPPPADTDGDGVPDAQDACPTVFAATANGCPAEPEETPTDGDDVLDGDELANMICGLGGDDEINGLGGNDTLYGDACGDKAKRLFGAQAGTDGDDRLNGGAGNDVLYGAGGRDVLRGLDGRDKLYGGASNDTLSGGRGKDHLDGGTGNDRLTGGGDGDRYKGGSGNDTISARNKVKESIDCGSGRDTATVDRNDKVTRCEKVKRPRK